MNGFIRSRDHAHSVSWGGFGVVHRLEGGDTHGTLAVVEHPIEPHVLGSPVHTHTNEDEYSFILSGQVTVMIGDEVFTAAPGDWVCKPRGIPHSFWNAQDTPACVLEVITPGGLEAYFDELAGIVNAEPVDIGRVVELQKRYGLISDPASIQELCQKYQLHL